MKNRSNKPTQPTQSAKPTDERNRDGLTFRSAAIEVRTEGDKQTVRMSVSSEAPVLTYIMFNERFQRAWEILDHGATSVDMTRCKDGLVILDRHYGDQIGLMAVEIEDRKLGGPVEFCTGGRAQEIEADAAKGLRRNVSVGYRVAPESYRLEGDKDGIPVVRAMSWMPYEASFEPVPADTTVGVGRAAEVKPEAPKVEAKEKKMDPKDIAKLYERAAKYGIPPEKVAALLDKPETARADLDAMIVEKQGADIVALREAKPTTPPAVTPPVLIGGDAKTHAAVVRTFSLARVCRHLMGATDDVGFEREVTQEMRKLFTGDSGRGKFVVPFAVLSKRATSLTESGTSSYSVGTTLAAGEFIDVLRPYSILPALGVQVMSGLVGNVAIPKQTAAGSGYWVSEEVDITRLAPTLGQVTLSPKTVGAACDVSYLLRMQSTPSAEQMVQNDIVRSVATKIEAGVFATGGAGSITPITSASGIANPTVTAGTPTYAQLLDFQKAILAAGAASNMEKWAISAATWAKLMATYNDGTTKSYPVLDANTQRLIGFPYEVSENVGTNAAFLGSWNMVILGVWGGGLEIKADESTLSLAGGVRIVGLQLVDMAVRQGAAFAYNTAVAA
ncbi:MAG: phage major capsid protein [Verrucomicrobia bacterium]|nr:phage major capsid protein [Verrucomicrobiota bacterium]